MFQFNPSIILFLILTMMQSSMIIFSQKKQESKPTSCQIATIQRDTVLVKLKEYPTQVKMLEAYQKQLQSEYDFKKLELDTKVKNYQDNEKAYNDAQKLEKVQELQNLDTDLKKYSQEAEQKLLKKEQELLQPMNDKINKAIEAVATKQGYTQIMDRKSVYFSLPVCDATKLVIEEANK
jgi:outer membrane protein